MYVCMDGSMGGWIDGRMYVCIFLYVWMDRWVGGCMYVCMYVCMYIHPDGECFLKKSEKRKKKYM